MQAIDSPHASYKTNGTDSDLQALTDRLDPDDFRAVYAAIQNAVDRATAPLLARIDALEKNQDKLNDRLHRTQGAVVGLEIAQDELEERFVKAIPEPTPQKAGPGTLSQREQIATYLKKSPNKRAALGEIRDFLGVSKSRLSQIIKDTEFIILQNRHDRRRRLLQLPAIF